MAVCSSKLNMLLQNQVDGLQLLKYLKRPKRQAEILGKAYQVAAPDPAEAGQVSFTFARRKSGANDGIEQALMTCRAWRREQVIRAGAPCGASPCRRGCAGVRSSPRPAQRDCRSIPSLESKSINKERGLVRKCSENSWHYLSLCPYLYALQDKASGHLPPRVFPGSTLRISKASFLYLMVGISRANSKKGSTVVSSRKRI